MRAVFLDYDTVSAGDLDTSSLTRVMPGLQFHGMTSDADIGPRVAGAGIVILNKCVLTRDVLRGAKDLKLVALAGTGTDNVDLAAAAELKIGVCNVRGYCTQAVMQQVWAMVLGLTQHLTEYTVLAKDGSWVRNEERTVLAHPIREL